MMPIERRHGTMSFFLSKLLAIFIITVIEVSAYELKCPHRSQWQQRAIIHECDNKTDYHCLNDINSKKWTEICSQPYDLPPGLRAVMSGNPDAAQCSVGYFAPYIAWSNDNVECPYQKLLCTEEGQLLLDNGSESEDIKCVCDYRRGYQYIVQPKHDCSCSPMKEDCTCILKRCHDEGLIHTPDYICIKQDQIVADMKCEISNNSKTNVNEDHAVEADEGPFSDTYSDKCRLMIPVVVLSILVIGVSVFTIWFSCMERRSGIDEKERVWKSVKRLSKFPDLTNKLNNNFILVLKGRKGTGKYSIATSLKRFNSSKTNTCRIIRIREHELGNYCLIKSLLSNIKETKLIILAEHISSELSSFLQQHNQTYIICDLDDDNFYDKNDKERILKLHRKINNIHTEDERKHKTKQKSKQEYMSKSLAADLLTEKTLIGFPWMCASLCKDHIHLGIRYFRQPPVHLISSLEELRKKGEQDDFCAIKYCLLVSVLLSDDNEPTVDNINIKSFGKIMTEIYHKNRMNCTIENVKAILHKSIPGLLKIDNDSKIKFSHHSIYQAVLISYGKNHTSTVMNRCNLGDIIFLLRPFNYHPLHDEMVLKANYSHQGFVKRVTESLMLNVSTVPSIIEQLTFFTETCHETDFLQLILTEIKTDKTYTRESRFNFFHHLDVFAHDFSESFKPELTAYCLGWDYVLCKMNANEKNSKVLKRMTDNPDIIRDVLRTCIDDYRNTLFHYFVIWNGQVEKSIIVDTLSKYTKGVIDQQQVINLCVSSEFGNHGNRTPLHFAAFFGRFDFFDNLKQINKIKRMNETWYETIENFLYQENSTLESLRQSGERYVSDKIKHDEYECIYFEDELVPSTLDIKYGTHEDFNQIMLLLRTNS